MERVKVIELINVVLDRQGLPPITGEDQSTKEANFRSLDFSEVALRVESHVGRELNFEAATIRQIDTFKDVLDFFETVLEAA